VAEEYHLMVAQVLWMQQNWSTMLDCRPSMAMADLLQSAFISGSAEYQKRFLKSRLWQEDSEWITMYVSHYSIVSLVFIGAYALAEKIRYGQGPITVGVFFSLLYIFKCYGGALTGLFGCLIEVERLGQLLHRFRIFLSSSEDIDLRMQASKRNLEIEERLVSRADSSPEMRLENVSFTYHKTQRDDDLQNARDLVLQGVSLTLPLGDACVLRGPAGCGKTTLLRLLTGSLLPTTGSVTMPASLSMALVDGESTFLPNLSINHVLGLSAIEGVTSADIALLRAVLGFPKGFSSISSKGLRRSPSVGLETPEQAIQVFHEDLDTDEADPHSDMPHLMSQRMQLLVRVAEALLSDPQLLLVSLKTMQWDSAIVGLVYVLRLWHFCGGLSGLIRCLRTVDFESGDTSDALRALITKAASSPTKALLQGQLPKTLVILSGTSSMLDQDTHGLHFNSAICFTSRSGWTVERRLASGSPDTVMNYLTI